MDELKCEVCGCLASTIVRNVKEVPSDDGVNMKFAIDGMAHLYCKHHQKQPVWRMLNDAQTQR